MMCLCVSYVCWRNCSLGMDSVCSFSIEFVSYSLDCGCISVVCKWDFVSRTFVFWLCVRSILLCPMFSFLWSCFCSSESVSRLFDIPLVSLSESESSVWFFVILVPFLVGVCVEWFVSESEDIACDSSVLFHCIVSFLLWEELDVDELSGESLYCILFSCWCLRGLSESPLKFVVSTLVCMPYSLVWRSHSARKSVLAVRGNIPVLLSHTLKASCWVLDAVTDGRYFAIASLQVAWRKSTLRSYVALVGEDVWLPVFHAFYSWLK